MTNKEAIDYLAIIYERSRNGKRAYHNKYQDAFDMAIEALKIEPCDDVVSRKAAIEAVEFGITYAKAIDVNTGESKELFKEGNDALKKASERIKDLPSAQPETHEERTETHACDLISRQAAIDAVYKCADIFAGDMPLMVVKSDAYEALAQLPSAQPETAKRIVGKSRDGMTLWYQCDMCNEPVDEQDNYCRGCGRRLIDG